VREPINERFSSRRTDGPSDIFRKFQSIFRIIGQSANPATNRQEFREWYVRNPPVEQQIDFVLREDQTSCVWFIIGHTGIGKSTVLGYTCDGNETAYSPDIGLLRIHISCNPLDIRDMAEWKDQFCAILEQACSMLEAELKVVVAPPDLARYIQSYAGDLLYRPNLPSESTLEERIEAVRHSERRAYLLERLKFLSKDRVKRICIIIDDLESLPHEIQSAAVHDVFRAHRSLTQNAGPIPCTSALVSLRPDTFAAIKKGISPFVPERIRFGDPVKLDKLFQARFDTALKKLAPRIGKPAEWQRCLDVMKNVAGRLDKGYGGTFVWLANHNVRDALLRFMDVLANRRWFQRDAKREDAFTLEEFNFSVTDVGVLRAMAMPVTDMYRDNSTTMVANLLHNSSSPRTDLLAVYVGRFLCSMCDETGESLWTPRDMNRLLDVADTLFETGDDDELTPRDLAKKTIEWMEGRELLFKLDEHGTGQEYSASPRLIELWRLMERNGLLLQCWREDVWRDMGEYPGYDRPNKDLSDTQLILESLRLCDEVIGLEAEHLRIAQARDKLPLMREIFGSHLISRQFLVGLQETRDRFFRDNDRPPDKVTTEIMDLLDELANKVRANEALLEPTE